MVEKKRKPKFIREEGRIRKRLGLKWRRPKGAQSKQRKRKAGKSARANIGYKNPEKIRGLVKGMYPVMIQGIKDLKLITENKVGIVASDIGMRKRIELLKVAQKQKVKLLNVKDVAKEIESLEKIFAATRTAKKTKIAERKKKAEAKDKKKKAEDKKKEKKDEKKDQSEETKPEEKKEEVKSEDKPVEKKEDKPKDLSEQSSEEPSDKSKEIAKKPDTKKTKAKVTKKASQTSKKEKEDKK